MSTIKMKHQHELGTGKAKKAVEKVARKLQKELNADYHWEGSTLQFKRSGASGHIDVKDDELDIEIKLGMLLSPLKGKIEQTIEDEIEEHLHA